MARSTKKSATQEIAEALNTPVNLNWCDVAEELGVTIPDLQERFAAKLSDSTVFAWDTIPVEHQPVVDAIARDLDAERSTRKLEPQAENPQLPEVSEPPILEEKLEAKPKRQRRSSALTEKKEKSIKETRQAATQTNAGISETLTLLQAQQGLIDSSQAGTAYLTTYTANLTNVKGEGLTVIAAQMLQEISQKSGFDPNAILQQVGVPLTPETQQKLQETMGQVLGKAQSAAEEIQQTSWGNGYDLQAELTKLNNLMNSDD